MTKLETLTQKQTEIKKILIVVVVVEIYILCSYNYIVSLFIKFSEVTE